MFFDVRRYDLAKVGRYKFNKKLALRNRIAGFTLAEDAVSPETGEVVAEAETVVSEELATQIQNAAVPFVMLHTEEGHIAKVLSNMMVDINNRGCLLSGIKKDSGRIRDRGRPRGGRSQKRGGADSETYHERGYFCFDKL